MGGITGSVTLTAPTTTSFFGVTSASGDFTSFKFTIFFDVTNTWFATADNVVLGTAVSTVPEPSTYALMAAGLAGLGFVAHRRRRALVA